MSVVEGFEHRPGVHCGSTAMADLLRWAGVELSESVVFGLGSGAGFYYLTGGELDPSRQIMGRSAELEPNVARALDLELRPHEPADRGEARSELEEAIDEGRPLMVACDLSELPYWETDTSFDGHRVVCAGYEGDEVLLADTHFEGLQRVSRGAFEEARRSGGSPTFEPPFKWWELVPSEPRPMGPAVRRAIERNVGSMVDSGGEIAGLGGMSQFRSEIGQWADLEDGAWCYRFAHQCIEQRGTGGGNFRLLYRDFLREAESVLPALAEGQYAASAYRTARAWTTLAEHLAAMASYLETGGEEPDEDPAHHVDSMAEAVYQFETTFWRSLETGLSGE